MAGVHVISIVIEDAGGHRKAINLHCSDTETLSDIQTFITAHLPKLDAMISGKIVAATVQMALTLPGGLSTTALADMLVDDGGLFGFGVTGTGYRYATFVPTVNLTLMDNDWSIADAGAVQTWEQSVLSGESAITLTNKHEQALASFLSGTRVKRKYKR